VFSAFLFTKKSNSEAIKKPVPAYMVSRKQAYSCRY
jgi:hypothetical protein